MVKKIYSKIFSASKQGSLPSKVNEPAFPPDFSEEEIALISIVAPYTMTSNERLVALLRAIDYLEANAITGDIVECGVWRGGSSMLALLKLNALGSQARDAFLFDTFEGMPPPSTDDKRFDDSSAESLLNNQHIADNDGRNIWCFASLEDVQQNMYSTGYPKEKIHFVPGKVEDTLPYDPIKKIALLRLDTDWYESTRHELETLFDKVEVGGVIIIDDYGHWQGCRKAVDEFIRERHCKLFLNRIDYTGRLAIKLP